MKEYNLENLVQKEFKKTIEAPPSTWDAKACENLKNAVVKRACDDYESALTKAVNEGRTTSNSCEELEKFFHDPLYAFYTSVDPDYLIEKLRNKVFNRYKISFLERYKYALRREKRIEDELEEWRSKAEKITPTLSKMPCGGGDGTAKFISPVEKIAEIERRLSAQLDEVQRVRDSVEDAINDIQEERLREVLALRYLRNMKWEQIASAIGYERRQVGRLHDMAIDKVKMS